MFDYPVLPAILPEHMWPGSITLLALFALLLCVLGLRRGGSPAPWLIASLLGTAFVLFARWHRYPAYPERTHDTLLREGIAAANFVSWFILMAVSVALTRRHPDSTKLIFCTWAFVGSPLLLWMTACVYPRSAAYATSCRSQLKSVGFAAYSYAETYQGCFYPLHFKSDAGTERSWRVEILPHLQESALRERYNDHEAWNASENLPVATHRRIPYLCPANERWADEQGRVFTAYLAAAGEGSAFGTHGAGRRWDDFPDGRENTILIVEACGQNVIWTELRDLDIAAVPAGVNLPGNEPGRSEGTVSAYHPGGPSLLLADGSVRTVERNVDPAVLRAMLTADGNETRPFD